MKYLAFICSLFTSVLSQTIQPPDGTYFVFNVAFKNRVIDDAGRVTTGEPIIGYPIHKGQKSTNQQWLVQTTGYNEDIHSVSMQSLTSIERDFEEGGYVGDTDNFIVQSSQAVSWDLIPVQASTEKYMIIKDDVAITQVQGGSETDSWQLVTKAVNISDTEQHWVFVSFNQSDTYINENGLKNIL